MFINARFTWCLSLCLLAFLSRPSLLPAINIDPGKATEIVVGGAPKEDSIRFDSQTKYYWFQLASARTISLQFTHSPDGTSLDNAWRIQVLDEGAFASYFDTKSSLADKGATCWDVLPSGKHYVMVQGLANSNGAQISLNIPYQLLLSESLKQNVKLLDENQTTDPLFLTLQEAFDQIQPDCRNCRVRTRGSTFDENLLFYKAVAVRIEGGKNNCFDKDSGYTTINGSLKVANGRVTVNRLILH